MKTVKREEIMNAIYKYKLDVTLNIVGNYPYTTEYKLRNGNIVAIESKNGEHYLSEEYIK